MTQVQVTISAPGNRRKLWRLPDDRMIGLLVPAIVERMELPAGLKWSLVRTADRKALTDETTLAASGVRPGAMLTLEPVRNTLFKQFLQALYDEAQGHVQDELWDKATKKLEELSEYDPRFPDPKGLRQLAQMGLVPSAAPVAGISWGLVIGGLAVAGTLAVGAAAAVGGAGYLIWQASEDGNGGAQPYDGGGGQPYDGGGVQPQTGDVQVTLEWYDAVDLDLYVYDPYGEEIYHGNPQAASGGELDVDANHPCSTATASPLENVFWPWGGAPGGEYQVHVRYYSDCTGRGAVSYRVTVRVDGNVLGAYSGTIAPGDKVFVTGFDY
jgi:hypothetical protein